MDLDLERADARPSSVEARKRYGRSARKETLLARLNMDDFPAPRQHDAPNEAIELFTGSYGARLDERLYQGQGRVCFVWQPPLPHGDLHWRSAHLPPSVSEVEFIVDQRHLRLGPTAQTLGVSAAGTSARIQASFVNCNSDQHEKLARGVFSIVNMPAIWGRGNLDVSLGSWEISIRQSPDHILKELNRAGGYAVTHACYVQREDGSEFLAGEFERFVADLHVTLSFLRRRYVGCCLARALCADGSLWEEWSGPTVLPWQFEDARRGRELQLQMVQQFTSGFYDLLADPRWREEIILAAMFEVEAMSSRSPYTSLVLAQAGLEILAWLILVEHGDMTPEEFDDSKTHPAHDRIRRLLEAVALESSIPENFTAALEFSKPQRRRGIARKDGPNVVAELRNAIFHASKWRKAFGSEVPFTVVHEAMALAQKYLRDVLLQILTAHRVLKEE